MSASTRGSSISRTMMTMIANNDNNNNNMRRRRRIVSTRPRRTRTSPVKVVVALVAAAAAGFFFVAILLWCCLLPQVDAFTTSVTSPSRSMYSHRHLYHHHVHHHSLQYHQFTTTSRRHLTASLPVALSLQASSSSSSSSSSSLSSSSPSSSDPVDSTPPAPSSTAASRDVTTPTLTTTRTAATNRLDAVLAKLTLAFPFFVLGTAIVALVYPSLLQWTNRGDWITIMLCAVMWGTGLTLTKDDFIVVWKQNLAAVPVGVLCQFSIMPLSAFLIGKTILWRGFVTTTTATTTASTAAATSTIQLGRAAFLGLCLVGCSPGGTASNLVSLIAKADVALSVLLTSCSTILASIVTPLLVKLLVGSTVAISGWTLCGATARVVLLPVLLGMVVNAKTPTLAKSVSRFTPFCSVVLVSLICGGVVAENASLLRLSSSSGAAAIPAAMLPFLIASVLTLHCSGFLAGYLVPKFGLRFSERTSRTIAIETGMQNSALAVVLARSIGAPPIASLPGALSATVHSCLGSILAAFWRGQDAAAAVNPVAGAAVITTSLQEDGGVGTVPPPPSTETPDDYPDLLI